MFIFIEHEGLCFNIDQITVIAPQEKWFRIGDEAAVFCTTKEIDLIMNQVRCLNRKEN